MPEKTLGTSEAGRNMRDDHSSRLDRHDVAIEQLGQNVSKLQSEVHSGFASVNSGFTNVRSEFSDIKNTLTALATKFDSRPALDFHQTIGTVVSIAVLFSMVVGGIIWITTSQNAAYQARQDAINERDKQRLDWQAGKLDEHDKRIVKVEHEVGRWSTIIQAKGAAR